VLSASGSLPVPASPVRAFQRRPLGLHQHAGSLLSPFLSLAFIASSLVSYPSLRSVFGRSRRVVPASCLSAVSAALFFAFVLSFVSRLCAVPVLFVRVSLRGYAWAALSSPFCLWRTSMVLGLAWSGYPRPFVLSPTPALCSGSPLLFRPPHPPCADSCSVCVRGRSLAI